MFGQRFNAMVEILMNCACNAEFAKVYDHLHSDLETPEEFGDGSGMMINMALVSLSGDEIHVDHNTLIPNRMIK